MKIDPSRPEGMPPAKFEDRRRMVAGNFDPSYDAERHGKTIPVRIKTLRLEPRILEYGNDQVERKLRSVIQNHRKVSYLFLGSRKHLIQKMVLDRNRPLYRAGGHYPLGPIA